jgi:HSP20 family protein
MASEVERWDPLREMMTLRSRIDRLFDTTFARPRGEWLATMFDYPVLDMYQSDGKIKLDIPLPGMKPEEVELTISGNTLTVKGERKSKEEVKDEHYYRHEMHYGAFTRTVALPEVADAEHPEAAFENGVLTVTFPRLTVVEPKRVEIKAKEAEVQPVEPVAA